MPHRFAVVALAVLGCTHTSSSVSGGPTPSTGPTATPLFAAYGGVGTVPDPLPPGYETSFATAAFDVDVPTATSGVSVTDFVLLDDHGAIVAPMKRVVELVQLPVDPPPAKNASGSWAFYLNPTGTPFGGTLAAGTSRLRVRVALQRPPFGFASRFRVTLGGTAPPLVIEGSTDGVWPT